MFTPLTKVQNRDIVFCYEIIEQLLREEQPDCVTEYPLAQRGFLLSNGLPISSLQSSSEDSGTKLYISYIW